MRILENIVGNRYGCLTVIKYVGGKPTRWECLCDCGATKEIEGQNLKSGNTRSCGCLQREVARETQKINCPGGRWKNYIKLSVKALKQNKAAYNHKNMKFHRERLTSLYIKSLLTKTGKLKYAEIPEELVRLKREHLKILRLLRGD